jgi:NitT/TauT family transport system permease protein
MTRAQRRRVLLPVAAIVGGLLAWEAAVRVFAVPLYILPAPSRVFAYMVQRPGLLLTHTVPTAIEIAAGFALGALVGVVFAVLIAQSAVLREILYPPLVASQVVPKVAIAPLILLWTGYGLAPKIVLAAMISFFPVVIDVTHGLWAVEPEVISLARSLSATRWQILSRIRLYSALPYFFSSLKVAATLAVIGAIVGEFVGASQGLGFLITVANSQMDTPLSFASLFILIVLGIVLFEAVVVVERWAIPWYVASHRER